MPTNFLIYVATGNTGKNPLNGYDSKSDIEKHNFQLDFIKFYNEWVEKEISDQQIERINEIGSRIFGDKYAAITQGDKNPKKNQDLFRTTLTSTQGRDFKKLRTSEELQDAVRDYFLSATVEGGSGIFRKKEKAFNSNDIIPLFRQVERITDQEKQRIVRNAAVEAFNQLKTGENGQKSKDAINSKAQKILKELNLASESFSIDKALSDYEAEKKLDKDEFAKMRSNPFTYLTLEQLGEYIEKGGDVPKATAGALFDKRNKQKGDGSLIQEIYDLVSRNKNDAGLIKRALDVFDNFKYKIGIEQETQFGAFERNSASPNNEQSPKEKLKNGDLSYVEQFLSVIRKDAERGSGVINLKTEDVAEAINKINSKVDEEDVYAMNLNTFLTYLASGKPNDPELKKRIDNGEELKELLHEGSTPEDFANFNIALNKLLKDNSKSSTYEQILDRVTKALVHFEDVIGGFKQRNDFGKNEDGGSKVFGVFDVKNESKKLQDGKSKQDILEGAIATYFLKNGVAKDSLFNSDDSKEATTYQAGVDNHKIGDQINFNQEFEKVIDKANHAFLPSAINLLRFGLENAENKTEFVKWANEKLQSKLSQKNSFVFGIFALLRQENLDFAFTQAQTDNDFYDKNYGLPAGSKNEISTRERIYAYDLAKRVVDELKGNISSEGTEVLNELSDYKETISANNSQRALLLGKALDHAIFQLTRSNTLGTDQINQLRIKIAQEAQIGTMNGENFNVADIGETSLNSSDNLTKAIAKNGVVKGGELAIEDFQGFGLGIDQEIEVPYGFDKNGDNPNEQNCQLIEEAGSFYLKNGEKERKLSYGDAFELKLLKEDKIGHLGPEFMKDLGLRRTQGVAGPAVAAKPKVVVAAGAAAASAAAGAAETEPRIYPKRKAPSPPLLGDEVRNLETFLERINASNFEYEYSRSSSLVNDPKSVDTLKLVSEISFTLNQENYAVTGNSKKDEDKKFSIFKVENESRTHIGDFNFEDLKFLLGDLSKAPSVPLKDYAIDSTGEDLPPPPPPETLTPKDHVDAFHANAPKGSDFPQDGRPQGLLSSLNEMSADGVSFEAGDQGIIVAKKDDQEIVRFNSSNYYLQNGGGEWSELKKNSSEIHQVLPFLASQNLLDADVAVYVNGQIAENYLNKNFAQAIKNENEFLYFKSGQDNFVINLNERKVFRYKNGDWEDFVTIKNFDDESLDEALSLILNKDKVLQKINERGGELAEAQDNENFVKFNLSGTSYLVNLDDKMIFVESDTKKLEKLAEIESFEDPALGEAFDKVSENAKSKGKEKDPLPPPPPSNGTVRFFNPVPVPPTASPSDTSAELVDHLERTHTLANNN